MLEILQVIKAHLDKEVPTYHYEIRHLKNSPGRDLPIIIIQHKQTPGTKRNSPIHEPTVAFRGSDIAQISITNQQEICLYSQTDRFSPGNNSRTLTLLCNNYEVKYATWGTEEHGYSTTITIDLENPNSLNMLTQIIKDATTPSPQ
jgi:hypothetical protein